ncbi:porin [Burkholderia sp. Ax-1719]|uniref:porin n=1 Tax=Burkholderia sp. Ax-1719 TaxID=2608334 RepID=UPI00141E5C08|nr:porin [Burkholderia sp. Ax-1719]
MESTARNVTCRIAAASLITLIGCAGDQAHAQSSVSLYGMVDAGVEYVSNSAGHALAEMESNVGVPARLGFRGSEDLGGGLSAIFQLESEFSINNGTSLSPFWLWGSYVGLRSDTFGTVTVGRQFDFLHASMPLNSTIMIEGGLSAGFEGFTSATPGTPPPAVSDHAGDGLYDNSVKWEKNFGPVSGGVMYGFGANNRHDSMQSAYLKYTNGGLQLGVGWSHDNFSTAQIANDVFSIRALYTIGGLTLLANYSQGKETVYPGSQAMARPFEVAANYYVTPFMTVGAGVGIAWDRSRSGESATIIEPYLGTHYLLSKRTMLYLVAALNHSSNPSVIPATVTVVGGAPDASSGANQLAVAIGVTTFF